MSKQRTKKPATRAAKVPVGRMPTPTGTVWTDATETSPRLRLMWVWTGTEMVWGFMNGTGWELADETPDTLDRRNDVRRVKGTS